MPIMRWQEKQTSTKDSITTQRQRRPPAGASQVRTKKGRKPAKLSRLVKPASMSLEDWQRELRRQFGREQTYRLKNLSDEPIFSEFEVTNPQTRMAYRVHIRGIQPGENYCSCPD